MNYTDMKIGGYYKVPSVVDNSVYLFRLKRIDDSILIAEYALIDYKGHSKYKENRSLLNPSNYKDIFEEATAEEIAHLEACHAVTYFIEKSKIQYYEIY